MLFLKNIFFIFSIYTLCSCCCSSVAKLCLILWPHELQQNFPVPHHLPEFAQVHDHWIGDAIQPSHPLLPFSPSAFIFPRIRVFSSKSALHIRWPKYCSCSFSFQLPISIQGWFPLRLTGLISLLSKRLSRVFSNTIVQKHQFFGALPSLCSSSHIWIWLLERP